MRGQGIWVLSLWFLGWTAGVWAQPSEAPVVVPVRLADLIRSALQKNLDLQLARLQPEAAEAVVLQQQAPFQPQVSANVDAASDESPTASILAGAPTLITKNTVFGFSFAQRTTWGTMFTVTGNLQRVSTNSVFVSLNPRYNSFLTVQITQPLLRGFGPWNTRAPLSAAEKRYEQSHLRLNEVQMDILLKVVEAYWDLVFAQKNLDVQKNSLALAEKLLEDTKIQIEIGVKAPIERTAAEAEVAARRQNVLEATNLVKAATDQLKALVEVTEELMRRPGEIWQPLDEPPEPQSLEPLEVYIERALRNRPALRAVEAQLEAAQHELRAARNQLWPQLDLIARYGWVGLGGDRQIFAGLFFDRRVIQVIPGEFTDAIHQVLRGEFPSWSVGLRLTLPISDTAARGRLLQAEVQMEQARIELERERQAIALQVRNAYRNLEAAREQYEAAMASVRLQREKLKAEQKKLELGLSTNFIVLQYQQDLALAEQRLLQAKVNYAKALAQLHRAIGEFHPERILALYGIESGPITSPQQ